MSATAGRTSGGGPDITRGKGAAAGGTVGLSVCAALMLLMIGVLQGFQGLGVLLRGDFFVVNAEYLYRLNTTTYGITQVLLAVLAILVGVGILLRLAAARYVGMAVAFVTAVANFLFIPYYPLWAIL